MRNIKKELSAAPVLVSFDLNCKHRVTSDASKDAIGACLLQQDSLGNWQPVEYASRKLTPPERNYATIEKEALGITWACEKFDYYLVGRTFEIETDHKPLIPLLGEKDLSQLPLRVQRFKMRLMRYHYRIFHTPGINMYLADSLSRPVTKVLLDQEIRQCASVECFVDSFVDNLIPEVMGNGLCNRDIWEATQVDSDAKQALDQIRHGWNMPKKDLSDEVLRMFGARARLTEAGGVILYGTRVYVPKALREVYLVKCHEGHQGITKCQRRARQVVWWTGIDKDIEAFVNNCETCIKNSAIKHQPARTSPTPRWSLGEDRH